MRIDHPTVGNAPTVRSRLRRTLWLGVGSGLVVFGTIAAVLSSAAAPVDSDRAGAWGGVVPIALLGLVGLRRHGVLLAVAGAAHALVLASLGFVLLRMNHYDAWVLVVLAVLAIAEVLGLLVLPALLRDDSARGSRGGRP